MNLKESENRRETKRKEHGWLKMDKVNLDYNQRINLRKSRLKVSKGANRVVGPLSQSNVSYFPLERKSIIITTT